MDVASSLDRPPITTLRDRQELLSKRLTTPVPTPESTACALAPPELV